MPLDIHRVVENAAYVDEFGPDAIQDEVARTANLARRPALPFSTEEQVIATDTRPQIEPFLAAGTPGIIGQIVQGGDYQGLIAQSASPAEMRLAPVQERRDISFGLDR